MGLLIKLQNGDTQLKSLKFGKDRPGGGDSGQPFLQESIDAPLQNPDYYNDFVLRGGIEAPISAAQDVARLTKYLASPKGLLFITKQELLSRTGTKTEASKGVQYLFGALNEGVYNPLNTLAQAGTGFLGAHFDKQEVKKYQDVIASNQPKDNFIPENNRLAQLSLLIPQNRAESNFSFVLGYRLNANNSLISYGGGPDSNLGVGKTYINFATSNYGDPDSIKTLLPKPDGYLTSNKDYYIPSGSVYDIGQLLDKNPDKSIDVDRLGPYLRSRLDLNRYQVNENKLNDTSGKRIVPLGATYLYTHTKNSNFPFAPPLLGPNATETSLRLEKRDSSTFGGQFDRIGLTTSHWSQTPDNSVYIDGTLKGKENLKNYLTKNDFNRTVSTTDEMKYTNSLDTKIVRVRNYTDSLRVALISGSRQFTFEDQTPRKFTPLPGSNLLVGEDGLPKRYVPYDLYEDTFPLYDSTQISNDINNDDLVPFIITVINPLQPDYPSTSIQFKSYVKSFSDSYGAEWNAQSYMGRAEKFYKYNSFSRNINFSFIVAATSPESLNDNYFKLNTLAASVAPTYSSQGYMAGNLHTLTFGNYVKNQYGILESVDYTIMDESPWETQGDKKLPFYIEVSCKFIPIQNFRPEYFPDTATGQKQFIEQTN